MNSYYINQLKDLVLDNSNQTKGRILELVGAIKTNSILWDDLDIKYKKELCMQKYDCGIDAVKIDEETDEIVEIQQMKNYSGYVTAHNLGTFFLYCVKFNDKRRRIIIGETTELPSEVYNLFEVTRITDDEIRYYVKNYVDNCDNCENCDNCNNNNICYTDCNENISKLEENDLENYYININNTSVQKINKFMIPCIDDKYTIILNHIIKNNNNSHIIIVPNITLGYKYCKLLKNYDINYFKLFTTCDFNNLISKKCNYVFICIYNLFDELSTTFDNYYIDEAHHILNNKLIDNLYNLPGEIFCFSSTLFNADFVYTITDAINDNKLCTYNFNIHMIRELNYEIVSNIILDFTEYSHCLIYCNSQETAIQLNEEINKNLTSECILYSTSQEEKELIFDKFSKCLLRCIITLNVLSEGLDLPIADSAIFYNDNKFSSVCITQCVNSVLMKHNNKKMSNVVIFSSDKDEDLQYKKYFDKLLLYDNKIKIKDNLNIKFEKKYYYSHVNIDIKRLQNDIYETICNKIKYKNLKLYNNSNGNGYVKTSGKNKKIIKKFSKNEKINLCKKFYNIYKRLPEYREEIDGFKIYNFIDKLRISKNKNKNKYVKDVIEEIFDQKIDTLSKKNLLNKKEKREPFRPSYDDKIRYCKYFYKTYNRIPKHGDIIIVENNNIFNIGGFIYSLKHGYNSVIKKDVEEIFDTEL